MLLQLAGGWVAATTTATTSIAQLSLKGNAFVNGEKSELDKILKDYEQKKPPAQIIMQSISNVTKFFG